MKLQDLLKLKEEDYDLFLQKVDEMNSQSPKYKEMCNQKISVAVTGVMNKGKSLSEEARKKMSESRKGNSNNKGKSLSEEARERISKAGLKPYAIYKGKVYTAIGLSEELGFKNYTKVSQIKSGKKKDEWGITFLETTNHKKETKPRNNFKHRQDVLSRPYAIINDETLTLTELSEKIGFNKIKIAHIKAGRTKNYLGITFL